MRIRAVPAPASASKDSGTGGRRVAAAPAEPVVDTRVPAAAKGTRAVAAPVAVAPDATDAQAAAYMLSQKPKRAKAKGGVNMFAVVAAMIIVGVLGAYLLSDWYFGGAELEVEKPVVSDLPPSLSPVTRTTKEGSKPGRLRPLGYETTSTHGLSGKGEEGLVSYLNRMSSMQATARADVSLLSPTDRRPGIGGEAFGQIPPRAPGSGSEGDADTPAMGGDEDVPALPEDRMNLREALSPEAYPPSGLEPRQYLVHLRNALNRPRGAKLDLEKVYILLSMYYRPEIKPEDYRGAIHAMASELYNRLAPKGDDGIRRVVSDGREQVRIVVEFMLHGLGPFHGWEVQEFHPGLISHGTPVQDQSFLVYDTLKEGPNKRNEAASTALNLLTLVLVRKLATDVANGPDDPRVYVPLYGVRLPDRTILRYDADGPFKPLPMDEADPASAVARGLLDTGSRNPTDPALAVRGIPYARNIELIRNGNHYSGAEYVRRMAISPTDVTSGTYLMTLDDKQFFASLGYELARADIRRRGAANYQRAKAILEEWVLDRDDGSGARFDGSKRVAPVVPSPRGDPGMRDAYMLYADMLLQQADYEGIKRQIDENLVLQENHERLSELRGLIAHQRARLESARAYLEDALKLSPNNPRAHLYLGDIDFIMDDGSLPDSLKGTDADRLSKAMHHFAMAESLDNGALNGQDRFLLHYHRALAHKRRGDLLPALADFKRVAEINPTFSRTPAFEKVQDRLMLDRAYEVLAAPSDIEDGQLKFQAVQFLADNIMLVPTHRPELMRCCDLIGKVDNVAAEWQLVKFLEKLTGWDHGRDGAAWKRHMKLYFDENR